MSALSRRIEKLEAAADVDDRPPFCTVTLRDWAGETEAQALERARLEGKPVNAKLIVFIRHFSEGAIR